MSKERSQLRERERERGTDLIKMALIINVVRNISAETEIAALITLSFAALLLLNLIRLKRKQAGYEEQALTLPPGPNGLSVLLSFPFLGQNLHHYLAGLARSYGPVLSVRLSFKLITVVSSPSAAREILRDQDAAFANRVIPATNLFYLDGSKPDILWAPYGTHWRMLRKIASKQLFSAVSVEAVAPLRHREMRRTVQAVWAQAKKGAAVDVRQTAFSTFLNMITSMLWGEGVRGEVDGNKFRRAIEGALDLIFAPNIAEFFPLVAPLDPQGLGRRLTENMKWMTKHLEEIVEKKKQKLASGKRSRDVLEALLDLVEAGDPQLPFTLDDLYKLLVDLIMASTDTTSSTIEWSMAELLSNPKKMRIVQQELDAVVGKHCVVQESDVPQLPYLRAIVKESLRLHPPAPLLAPHSSSSHCVLGGFSIPAETTVLINVWAIQRDPHLWGEDAEEFKPERFFKGSKEEMDFYTEGNNQFYYLPFGAGRRVCPGAALGQKMIIYTLASLLHSFEWQLPEGASLNFEEKFASSLRKAKRLIAVPAIRLDKQELYA